MKTFLLPLFAAMVFATPILATPSEAEIARLMQGLRSPDAQVRVHTADEVQKMEEIPDALMPELFDLVMAKQSAIVTREQLVGSVAVHFADLALAKFGKQAVPRLREYMKSPDTRWPSVGILKRIGPDATDAVPELTEALADPNKNVRSLAVDTLKKLGPKAAPAVDALIVLLGDKYENLQEDAAETLAEIGAPAKKAIPRLQKLAKPEYTPLAMAAKEAIEKIQSAK